MRKLSDIAVDIYLNWVDKNGHSKVYFAAKPYLEAMSVLEGPDDMYYDVDAETIVMYFLSNAATFRGERARAVKAELKGMFDIK